MVAQSLSVSQQRPHHIISLPHLTSAGELGQEISRLVQLERGGTPPEEWRVHPQSITLQALVPQVDPVRLPTTKLGTYPNSRPLPWDTNKSDWVIRVAHQLSSNWDAWCNEYDPTPPGLLDEARMTLEEWNWILPELSLSDKLSRFSTHFAIGKELPLEEARRRKELRSNPVQDRLLLLKQF